VTLFFAVAQWSSLCPPGGLLCGRLVVARRLAGGALCRGRLSAECWWSLAESAALLVRKEDAAVDQLAGEALAVAGGVDLLQSCPLDVSGAVFRIVSVAVTDWC
jgi:hypothetical protein